MSDHAGTLGGDGELRSVRFVRGVDASVEEVWSALVEPERLGRWPADATVDAREGGSVELRFGDEPGARVSGAIRAFDPPRLLEYDWAYEGGAGSVVRFELRPAEAGSILVVEHRLLSPSDATGYAAGWHAYLDLLAEELGGGVRSDWQARFDALLPAYERQAAHS